jgi:hypothetical protein
MGTHHSRAGKLGAFSKWANTPDRKAATAKARQVFNDRFHAEARLKFPDADEATIDQLAQYARREYYMRLSMLASAARAKRAKKNRAA